MENPTPLPGPESVRHGQAFPTTHWTTLLVPIHDRAVGAAAALERLLAIYRPPLLICARRWTRNPGDAEDLVHDYILNLLRRDDLAKIQRDHGRFRSFLSAGLRNLALTRLEAQRARKRGGGAEHLSIEESDLEPPDPDSIEAEYCRRWIQVSVDEVLKQLTAEWEQSGRLDEFQDLKDCALTKKGDVPRADLAAKYGVSLNAIDAKVSRLRRRFRELLHELIAQTVRDPAEVGAEIRYLMGILSR